MGKWSLLSYEISPGSGFKLPEGNSSYLPPTFGYALASPSPCGIALPLLTAGRAQRYLPSAQVICGWQELCKPHPPLGQGFTNPSGAHGRERAESAIFNNIPVPTSPRSQSSVIPLRSLSLQELKFWPNLLSKVGFLSLLFTGKLPRLSIHTAQNRPM